MLKWSKSRTERDVHLGFFRAFNAEGVLFARARAALPEPCQNPVPVNAAELDGLLVQLDDEGLTEPHGESSLLRWEAMFQALSSSHYPQLRNLAALPPDTIAVPGIESHNGLTDRNFAIALSGWIGAGGRSLRDVKHFGAILETDGSLELMSLPAWQMINAIDAFRNRMDSERDGVYQRRRWGEIRRFALAARAELDGFLRSNIVLTPEKLEIRLDVQQAAGTRVVQVIPSFPNAPEGWLNAFDSGSKVHELYNIKADGGIVQVLISSDTRTVLEAIKKFPGRRVAGARAEAFLVNPFAALGEAASRTIDEAQFEEAKAAAGLQFEQFTALIEKDAVGYPIHVALNISTAGVGGVAHGEIRAFSDDTELKNFIERLQTAIESNHPLCGWEGYEFEILGETPDELARLSSAHATRQKPRVLVSYAHIHDLSVYTSRIETIGSEVPYYSLFIAKKNNEESWFPENIVPFIAWTPDGQSEPVAVPLTPEAREQLQAKREEAQAKGESTFKVSGFAEPLPVFDTGEILKILNDVEEDAGRGIFDPAKPRNGSAPAKKHLVLKANIQSIDYTEARYDILQTHGREPELPSGLRPEIELKAHQRSGVAWLQHLFANAPHHCRGAILADDMGLGKTLQLLTLLASAFEQQPNLSPALIVAPVSLLENWEEEAGKFLLAGTLKMLTAYGDALVGLRAPRETIDEALRRDGLVRFLTPGWRNGINVVLTTYETLRDFEFTFAVEKWSIMICDEAQFIKNPNAMRTRAAKAQNVTFKIACTGTPVENSLTDLWCLFDFVQPGLLGALDDFGRRYRRPIETETEEEEARITELRALIAPQILRRTKSEVAKDLPPKREIPSMVPLSKVQRSLYAHAIKQFKKRQEFTNHLGLLHYLRQLCTDPRPPGMSVFQPEPVAQYRAKAPKLDWLLDNLRSVQKAGEKAIIFCEFREIQRLLRHYIQQEFAFVPEIINGDISANAKNAESRQKRIRQFQEKPGFGAIILSPVAVGFGVNIQAANHVIHYMRTWNPAKEDQATDRAYRIGQTRPVYVYCPTTEAADFITFDVKLDKLLAARRALAGDMLNGSSEIRPGEFPLEDVMPEADGAPLFSPFSLEDTLRMEWSYFECLVAALWLKQGFRQVYCTPQHDIGVDVVAINGSAGVLIQCKTGGADASALGWNAIHEVIGGEAAYRVRHPGITFKKICAANLAFNGTAREQAALNNVELIGIEELAGLLSRFPVTRLDVDRMRHPEWTSE